MGLRPILIALQFYLFEFKMLAHFLLLLAVIKNACAFYFYLTANAFTPSPAGWGPFQSCI